MKRNLKELKGVQNNFVGFKRPMNLKDFTSRYTLEYLNS